MQKLIRLPFLAVSCLLLGMMSCTSNGPDTVSEANAPLAALSTGNTSTYYHHDGTSSTAREVAIQRNADGSVTITKTDVPLGVANGSVDFVALDADETDRATRKAAYNASSTPSWYIPFEEGPVQKLATGGEFAVAICHCKSYNGFCMNGFGPQPPDGSFEWSFCAAVDCFGGCYGSVSFSVSGEKPAGITLRATQVHSSNVQSIQ